MKGTFSRGMNLKTSLDEKTILFVPAFLAWYFVSAGFSPPDKMPGVPKTSNEIIIINKFLRTTTLKILICSFRLYFHVVFFSKPIKM